MDTPDDPNHTVQPTSRKTWQERLYWSPSEKYSNIRDRLNDKGTRLSTILVLMLGGFVLLAGIGWIYLMLTVPSPKDMKAVNVAESSVVFTVDGKELTRYHDKNRTWVPLDSISAHVPEALIAIEDRRFYDHAGVDVWRLVGSSFRTLAGDPQGGSTITMQLTRNAFPEIKDDFVLIRKMKEWLTALRLEEQFSKREILEMYLNTVPFMYNSFGIEAAAHTYFQKSAIDLDPVESAALVGMLKGTVLYNPYRNPERSLERRNVVMQEMVRAGYMKQAAYDSLSTQETPLRFRRSDRADNLAPYFAEYARQWLGEWAEDNGYNLYTDGLKIYTTIDSELQAAAEQAATEVTDELQAVADVEWSRSRSPYFSSNARDYVRYRKNVKPFAHFWANHQSLQNQFIQQSEAYRVAIKSGLAADTVLARLRQDAAFLDSLQTSMQRIEVGFLAMDPRDGNIKAWVGGRDFGKNEYDHVATAKRQPGSTFKPFVYAAALDRGYQVNDRLPDEVIEYRDPDTRKVWKPQNVGGASGEPITLRDALAYSKNTITAQLVVDVGPHRVAQMAHRMGVQSDLDEVPSLGLGTSEVTLLEMVSAYTTLASQGRYREPVLITRIEDRNGRVVATFRPESRNVVSGYTAYSVLDMMRGVVDYGTGQRIKRYGATGDFAGKTGTSQNGADGWFMLMHPHLVMGSWVGFSSPSIRFRTNYWGQGAHNALLVVGEFYQEARKKSDLLDNATFAAPAGWSPPPPPDTTSLYAYDSLAYDFAYDSLYARTDSILARADSMLYGSMPDTRTQAGRDTDSLLTEVAETASPDSTTTTTIEVPARAENSVTDSLNAVQANRKLEVTRRPQRSIKPTPTDSSGSRPQPTGTRSDSGTK